MKKKAPTNKERDKVITSLIDKVFHHEMILSLILENDKELDKRIRDRILEIERSRSENKKGT